MPSIFTQKYEIPSGVLIRELAGESVLLNLNSEAYFGLDEVGTRMWGALTSQGLTAEQAVDLVLFEFDVDRTRLQEDMRVFIGRLLELGLLDVSGS